MSLDDLLAELGRLSRAEKLHVIQHLAHDLEVTEQPAPPQLAGEFEVWSPQDAGGAVATLHKLLEEHQQGNAVERPAFPQAT